MASSEIICDTHHVSRYCSPDAIIKSSGLPKASVFMIDEDEPFLSVHWPEYFKKLNLNDNIDMMREDIISSEFCLRPHGRFAVQEVKNIKDAINTATKRISRIVHWPDGKTKSHSAIFGYNASDIEVAGEIALLFTPSDMYAALQS